MKPTTKTLAYAKLDENSSLDDILTAELQHLSADELFEYTAINETAIDNYVVNYLMNYGQKHRDVFLEELELMKSEELNFPSKEFISILGMLHVVEHCEQELIDRDLLEKFRLNTPYFSFYQKEIVFVVYQRSYQDRIFDLFRMFEDNELTIENLPKIKATSEQFRRDLADDSKEIKVAVV